jgi:hypothetical protein
LKPSRLNYAVGNTSSLEAHVHALDARVPWGVFGNDGQR